MLYDRKLAKSYANYEISKTTYLAFRDIPKLVDKYVTGKKVLDYGCGAGRSTRFLKSLGLQVQGVDISFDMIKEAQSRDKDVLSYMVIEDSKVPSPNEFYDFVFSSFVFVTMPTKENIFRVCCEINRILAPSGVFIFVVSSEELYKHNWLSLYTDYPENKNLKSGEVKITLLKDLNLKLYDYYWTYTDYLEIIKKTGFFLAEKVDVIGNDQDGYDWVSEKIYAPYSVYVLTKARSKVSDPNGTNLSNK